jgi:energy-coupling factor transport system ATP-binding protein
MGRPIIQIRDLSFGYTPDRPVLQGINLDINRGEFVALIGQNGSGKTTLSKHLNGILKGNSGTVLVDGLKTAEASITQLAAKVGYCYQNPDHQIFNATVKDEIEFGPRNLGMDPEKIKAKVEEVLDIVGLRRSPETYPFELSKGERQKLAVASILAMEPPILVIDEPTTGLDWRGSVEMMNLMRQLNEAGHTLIVITHDMRLVAAYSERVVVMFAGQIIADGTPHEVLAQADVLESACVRPPQITRLVSRLVRDHDQDIALSVGEAVEILIALRGGATE